MKNIVLVFLFFCCAVSLAFAEGGSEGSYDSSSGTSDSAPYVPPSSTSTNPSSAQRAAVLPFEVRNNAVSTDEALVFYGDFNNRFSRVGRDSGLFSVVPRMDVERLFRQEAAFQLSDLSDSKKTAEYARVLNADWVISGSITKAGTRIVFMISMYIYPDFTHLDGSQVYARNIDELIDKIPELIGDIQGSMTSGREQNAPRQYKIGDTGPGGGIVFYLEASGGLEVSRLLGDYNWNDAINAARNYRGGGMSDWYLPTKTELNLVYVNLHKAGIVNLGASWYWSSSQVDNKYAWGQYFGDGRQYVDAKNKTGSVRAVRAF